MEGRQWYTSIGGQQGGPYSDGQLRQLVTAGTVRADTAVWCNGMKDWARAADIPGLLPQAQRAAPSPPSGPPALTGQNAGQALSTSVGVWPLFGRALLLFIGQLFIIPAPWVVTSFYRWFVDHIELPGGQRAAFTGKPLDIWYIFIVNALCGYAGYLSHYLQLVTLPLIAFCVFMIARWFWRSLVWQGQTAPLHFTGSYWGMLGWYVLTIFSIITIVGWAWVSTAWTRWMCRHVEGSARQLMFNASGLSLLWRSVLFVLSCMVLIPIPWTLRWYTRWLISQFSLSGEPDLQV